MRLDAKAPKSVVSKVALGVMFYSVRLLIAASAVAICATAAQAVPITYTFSIASGSASFAGDSTAYTGGFTITAHADTDDIEAYGSGYWVNHSNAEISGSFGTVALDSGTRTFVNNNTSIVGFSREGSTGYDLLNGAGDESLSSYDLSTEISTTGSAEFLQWSGFSDIVTSLGVLTFSDLTTEMTFTATLDDVTPPAPVPVPAAGLLLLGGIGALTALRRRSRAA